MWNYAPVPVVTFTPRDPARPFFPSHTQGSGIESDALGSSFPQETLDLFWHNALIAVYQALIGLDPVSESTSVEGTVLSLARLDP